MMSDEIDIEEHDLLDNPTIRRIFPDLSVIKREISEYEEGFNTDIEEPTSEVVADRVAEVDQDIEIVECVSDDFKSQNTTQKTLKDKKLEVHLRFKTFLDSLADDVIEVNNTNFDTFSDVISSSPEKLAHTVNNMEKKETKSSDILNNINSSSHKKRALSLKNKVKQEFKSSDTFDDVVPSSPKRLASTVMNMDKKEFESMDAYNDVIPSSSKKSALTVNMDKKEFKSMDTFDEPSSSKKNTLTVNMDEKLFESSGTFNEPSSCKKNIPTPMNMDNFFFKSSDAFNDVIPSSFKKNKSNDSFDDIITSSSEKMDKKEIKSSQNNIFIIGSKPNLLHTDMKSTDKRQLKLVLKNVGPFLKESTQYCKLCFILFPNVHVMKCHMNKIHCLSDCSKKINYRKGPEIKFQCDICNGKLSSKGNLARHLKEVHGITKSETHFKKINKIRRIRNMPIKKNKTKKSLCEETKTKLTGSNKCFHCHKHFESQTSLIEHLYDVLNPNQNKSNNFEEEKQTKTTDSAIHKDGDNINNIRCTTCALDFLRQSELDEHNSEIHLNSKSTLNNKSDHIERNDLQEAAFQGLIGPKLIENIRNTSRLDNLVENDKILTSKNKELIDIKRDGLKPDHHNSLDHQSCESSLCFNASDNKKQDIVENSADLINIQNKKAYQCFICSQYIAYWKWYSNHMASHNIKNMCEVDTVVFDPQCKFCDVYNPNDIRSFNRHISNAHQEKRYKKINIDEKAFNSILFKCARCEVFFLTAHAAKKHCEHEAIFVNWKCSDCQRLFKIKDKAIHKKQHLLSKNITAYALCDSALNKVLYKCLKCAVHFSEKEYFVHYALCDFEMPNSAYCNTCDILINRNDMAFHERNHKDKKLQLFEFTLIESDIMYEPKEQNEMDKQNPHVRSKFALTFCSICHCFLSDLGRKRIAHIDGRCRVLNPRMCSKCGLIFTNRGYLSHKMLHDKMKNLNVQTFYFYDIKSKKQIRPPMPKYPNCNMCEVHFLNKKAVIGHVCSEQSYTTCNVCEIKLSESAYKLHVAFHKYKLSSSALSRKESISFNAESTITSTTNSNIVNPKRMLLKSKIKYKLLYSALKKKESSSSSVEEIVTSTTSTYCNAMKNSSPQILNLNISDDANVNKSLYLYTCIPCQLTVNMYDKVVQHCHDHYDYKESVSNQNKEYSNSKYNENVVTKLKFDPFYFRFENEIWNKHIFEKLTQEQVKYILEHSKYKFECRLKMEEIQTGSLITRSTLYKCDICRSYIEPNELYAHASNTCTMTKKHPCSICGLCFSSSSYKDNHEKTHESNGINMASYRIILFNKTVHQLFTQIMLNSFNKFILYQCRNCEVIIDKLQRENHQCNNANLSRCSSCGLLFYDRDFKLHARKHEMIKHFKPEKMIVIMFSKVGSKRDNKLKPCFSGKIYDLTFYKCTTCGLCMKSKNSIYKHVCVSKAYETQCPKCYLCFSKEDLKEHFQLHENNLELVYDDFNSNIISFSKNTMDVTEDSLNVNENVSDKDCNVNSESNANMTQKIFKCDCGLHFLEEVNANKHNSNCNPRMKISKQSCFKCDLLFTPGELFNHLLKHHSNKKLQYKYDIINVPKSREEKE